MEAVVDRCGVTRTVDLATLATPAGVIRCPSCGGMRFTAELTGAGLVLACWEDPVYIRPLLAGQEGVT